ncbi:MAG: HAD family hydrolase [Chloroflexi bacterium]|nr:HAD family hydrolase [Chloroflexota bacterium]
MTNSLPAPDQLQAVLFDLDDTLIDARGSWRAGFAESIEELHAAEPGLQALGTPEEIYDGYFRHYTEDAFRAAGRGEWDERFTLEAYERLIATHLRPDPALAERLADHYRAIHINHIGIYPDAIETLEAARARYPLALITNGLSRIQRPKIERFDLERYFEVVVVSGEAGLQKPDPAIFALALEPLGVAPEATVYIGDNPYHDVVGAHAAGVGAIWVNRGDWHVESGDLVPDIEVRELRETWPYLGLE